MTRDDAGRLTAALVVAYPTQKRSKEFLALLGSALVNSGLDPYRVAGRIDEWIKTQVFWPSIAEVIEPFDDPPQPTKFLPVPKNVLPSDQGVRLFRQLTQKGTTDAKEQPDNEVP